MRAPASTLALCSAVCLLLVGGATGCRNDASQRDAYIRELRTHENQIYELKDYMSEYQELLCEQRRENAQLRARLAEHATPEAEKIDRGDELDDAERSLLDRPPRENGRSRPDTDLPEIDLGEPTMPEVDLGEPVPGGELEEVPTGDLDDLSQQINERGTRLASASMSAGVFTPPPRPSQVAESCAIYAEQMPMEPDSSEGANIGLMAIVEPLTSSGGAGYFTGEVSFMLVDPLADDQEWEIARWDYTAEEVEAAWRDHSRRVLDLPLAVPSEAPLGRPLELWVRLMTNNEESKILCSTAITLTEPTGLIGVPVSGGQSSTDPAAPVSTGWAAADELGRPSSNTEESNPATWQAATTMPPPAVARAEPQPPQRRKKVARRAPDWSPFR